MNDIQVLSDPNDPPENASASHSWGRQHAKHRDFPASRLQARERARLRVQQAIQEERQRARNQAQSWRAAGVNNGLDGEQDGQPAPEVAIEDKETPLPQTVDPEQKPPQLNLQPAPQIAAQRDPNSLQDPVLAAAPPLGENRDGIAGCYVRKPPAETLQDVRDRLAARWFALKGRFEEAAAPELLPAPVPSLASATPVLAVFSLAGGVGKTSLVATLARTLSSRGEHVLLVETAPFGLLPCFFGARDRRPGVLRTFAPPEDGAVVPVQTIALDADVLAVDAGGHDPLAAEIARYAQAAGRVIVDIATASAAVARRVLRMAPIVLVPVVPDTNSVVNAGFIDCLFHRTQDAPATSSEVYYVLNQFDSSLPLHLDVREVLRERLGDRLLPFALRRTPAISEALAEGMTVVDYAPASPVADDFNSLAAWIKARSASAGAAARARRWTEK